MTSYDFTILAGHVYIAASMIVLGLNGNRRIGTSTAALGVFLIVLGFVAKTVSP